MSDPLEARMAAFGFHPDESNRALQIIVAMAAPDDAIDAGMDLARYVRIPLTDAVWAMFRNRELRRLGLAVPAHASVTEAIAYVRSETAGQAEAYTTTFSGRAEVRHAQGALSR